MRLFDLGGAFSANEKKAKNPAKVSGEQKKGPGKGVGMRHRMGNYGNRMKKRHGFGKVEADFTVFVLAG